MRRMRPFPIGRPFGAGGRAVNIAREGPLRRFLLTALLRGFAKSIIQPMGYIDAKIVKFRGVIDTLYTRVQ